MNFTKVWIIIGREFSTRVKKRAFIVLTLLAPVLISGILGFSVWISAQEGKGQSILVVDDNYPVFKHIKSEPGLHYIYQNISLEQAQTLLFEGAQQYTAVLYLPKNIINSKAAKFYVKEMPNAITQRRVEKQLEQLIELQYVYLNNIPLETYQKFNIAFRLTPYKLEESGKAQIFDLEKAYLGWGFAVAIFMMVTLYCTMVMRSVMEEKISKIIDVLISSVKPIELMMGKVIGVAMVGVFQVVLWIALSFILFLGLKLFLFQDLYDPAHLSNLQLSSELSGQMQGLNTPPIGIPSDHLINRVNFEVLIPLFLFYYIAGYLLYSGLFAAVGSFIDNESETQQFVIPLTIPLIFAYVISFSVVRNPEGSLAFWTSIIPFTSPIIMMIRASIGVGAGGGIPVWEVVLSMLILIGSIFGTIYLAAKIYKKGVLNQGKKPSIGDLWAWINA